MFLINGYVVIEFGDSKYSSLFIKKRYVESVG